jgi:hypothetical protein
MQILRKKSDNTVWHIYPEAAVITIDADGVSYTSPNGSEKWTSGDSSTEYEIITNVAKPSNGRFYGGGVETYKDGAWTFDNAAVQVFRDIYIASGRIYDEDAFNITWRMS